MKTPVMGIQLYTLRDYCKTAEDFDATLARLAAMGVKDVQISGIGDISAEDQKAALDRNGMSVCVTHKSFERMETDLAGLVEEHKIIGCDALGIGSAPDSGRGNSHRVKEFIKKAEAIGTELKATGMTFNYHNHAFEFNKLDDMNCSMMELLIKASDPELFYFIPDVAWIHYADNDPVEILKKLKGRVKVLHFKDYIIDENGYRKFVALGDGIVDLKACFEAAKELEIPYIMYEQDCDWENGDPFISTEKSWKFMQSLLK